MKTKIKRHSRSVLSVILAISMLVSCMMVGIIATDAARVNSEKVGLNSGDGIHLGIGTTSTTWHGMGNDAYEFTLNSTTTIYYTFSVSGSNFGKGNQGNPGSDSQESYTYCAIKDDNTQYSISLPAGTYKFKLKGIQSSNANALEYQFWVVSSGGGGGDEPGGDATEVTDADLISVLKRQNIMFYHGDELGKNTTKYIYGSNNNTNLVASNPYNFTKTGDHSCYLAIACVPAASYYISNSTTWEGQNIGTPTAGTGYCIWGTGNNEWHPWSSNATVSWSTSSATVKYGATSSGISATKSGSTAYAALGSVKYYYQDGTKFYEFDPSSLPALEPGTYNVYAAASDGKIYIAASSTGTLTVREPLASSLSISADPTELTATGQSSTITVTATDIASGVTNLTYTIYDRANDNPVGDPVTVTDGATSATFTVTPNARSKSYYASVKPTSSAQQALYDEVWTSTDATISNSADAYIPRYTVTFSSNDNTKGTVTAKTGDGTALTSGAEVKEGTSVIFTAAPKAGQVFVNWTGIDSTASTVTSIIHAATTVVGNFGPKGYKILAGASSTEDMRELANGTYISPITYAKGSWFEIVRNSTGETTVASENTQGVTLGNKYAVTNWQTGTTWRNTNVFKIYDNESGDRYIVYDPATNQVWLTADKDDLYDVTVVAKDGTIRDDYATSSNFGNTTISMISPNAFTNLTSGYEYSNDSYRVNSVDGTGRAEYLKIPAEDVRNGVTIKVATQVDPTYLAQGFYVKGFAVSGVEESYSVLWQEFDAEGNELSNYEDKDWIDQGYNEFELTIEGYPDKAIEITPIYFKKETKSGDNVRFYVDGFAGDVYDEWGGTLSVDVYDTSNNHIYGDYPGQLMINYNGRYIMDFPRENIKGLTLNSYVWDKVHCHYFCNDSTADNYQTYDFNDFVYIKDLLENDSDHNNDDEDIIFSFRLRNDSNHNTKETSQLGKATYYENSLAGYDVTYDYRTNYSTINPNDNIYQWESLTDFYGNRIDIFSDYVDTVDTDGHSTNDKAAYTNPIRIVSNGYDYDKAGNYATAWAVYAPLDASNNLAPNGAYDHYGLVDVFGGQGRSDYDSSSYLLNRTHFDNLRWKYDQEYNTAHSSETPAATFIFDLAKMPTVISYEFQVKDGHSNLNLEGSGGDGEVGIRSDGRWYYSKSDQLLKANVVIEYAEKDDNSLYHRDYFQANGVNYTSGTAYVPTVNTGLATGIKAYFDNEDADTAGTTSYSNTPGNTQAYAVSDGKHTFNLTTVGDPNGDYTFKGWYLYSNGKYSLVSRDAIYPSEATANDVYVARYYKTPSGTLNVTHELHPDSTGKGTCYAKVEVMDGNTVKYIYNETTNPIKVTNTYMKSDSNNTLKITLRTVTDSKTGFDSFKMKLSDTIQALEASGVIANVSDIDTSTPNEYKVIIQTNAISTFFDNEGSQTTKSLPFYSLLNEKNFAHTKILYSPAKYLSNGFDSDLTQNDADTVISALTRDYYQSGVDWTSASGYDKTVITGNSTEAQAYMTASGNNVTEVDFNANDTITLNAVNSPSQNSVRYSFVGWIVEKTAADGTKTTVKLSNSYTTPANTYTAAATDKELVFIAVFEPVLKYVIKYTYDSTHYGSQYYQVTGTFTAAEIATYLTWSDSAQSADNLAGAYSYNSSTKQEFFAAKSPYEKNVGKKFQWEFSNDTTAHYSANLQLSSTVPSHNGTDTTRKIQFEFPYRVKSTNSGTESQKTGDKVYKVPDDGEYRDGQYSRYLNIDSAAYGSPYTLNWEETNEGTTVTKSSYITAEEKIFDSNEDEYHFAYWSLQNIPINVRTSNPNPEDTIINYDNQVEVARCYNLEFNFTIYQDYIVEPVYVKSTAMIPKVHSDSATITFVESGRNQWNANGGGTGVPETQKTQGDKIFLQFMTAYDRNDMMLLNSQTNVEVGILYERLDELTAEQKEDVPSPINLFNTYGGSDSTHGEAAAKAAVATTTNTTVGKQKYAIMKLDSAQKLQKIDNKNRIALEQGVTHKNNQGQVTGYANYVYRAYAYMKEANGNVTISEQPVYFTFYTIANMADGSRQG